MQPRVVYCLDTDPIRLPALWLSIGTLRKHWTGPIIVLTDLDCQTSRPDLDKLVDDYGVKIEKRCMHLRAGAQWPQYVTLMANCPPREGTVDIFCSAACIWRGSPQELIMERDRLNADLMMPLQATDKKKPHEAQAVYEELDGRMPNPFYVSTWASACAQGCCGTGCAGIKVYNPVAVLRHSPTLSSFLAHWADMYQLWYENGKHTPDRPAWPDVTADGSCSIERRIKDDINLNFRLISPEYMTPKREGLGSIVCRMFGDDHKWLAEKEYPLLASQAWEMATCGCHCASYTKHGHFVNCYK